MLRVGDRNNTSDEITSADLSAVGTSLCAVYRTGEDESVLCDNCPVYLASGEKNCGDTPMTALFKIWANLRIGVRATPARRAAWRAAARRSARYLRNLASEIASEGEPGEHAYTPLVSGKTRPSAFSNGTMFVTARRGSAMNTTTFIKTSELSVDMCNAATGEFSTCEFKSKHDMDKSLGACTPVAVKQ